MKKTTIETRKLVLNKSKVTNLTASEMNEVQGGFTRALHTSIVCHSGQQTCCSNDDGRCNFFAAQITPVLDNAVNIKSAGYRIP